MKEKLIKLRYALSFATGEHLITLPGVCYYQDYADLLW